MYGSTDMKRLRTTTSWFFGTARVFSATAKFAAAGFPLGWETR
jgi:hypothetical protein